MELNLALLGWCVVVAAVTAILTRWPPAVFLSGLLGLFSSRSHATAASLSRTKTASDRSTLADIPSIIGPQTTTQAAQTASKVQDSNKLRPMDSLMPPPPKPIPHRSSSVRKSTSPKPSPPKSATPPSRTSSLRAPTLGAMPNRTSSLTANPRTRPASNSTLAQPRGKVVLEPGHSPLDWAHLTATTPSTKLAGVPMLLRVTPSQLAHHNGRKGRPAWSSFRGKVYNMTPYMPFHPGGEDQLRRAAGKSGDKLFDEIHPWINYEGMLGSCLVGVLVSESESESAKSQDLEALD